jgi:DNA-binding NarL/FixJ family response regulator
VKTPASFRAGNGPLRVVVVGDTCVREAGMAAIVSGNRRFRICGGAHVFSEARDLIQQERPDILLIEPFLENRDGLRWIKDLATEFSSMRILVVSRQSERVYAERALHAGAAGYWMENGSRRELLLAVNRVAGGEVYVSPVVASLAARKLAGPNLIPHPLDVLSDREIGIFSLIADGRGVGQIASELGISRKTVETHCEHIKLKLKYSNADELRRGARDLLGQS